MKLHAIAYNTIEYNSITCNTMQYNNSLGTGRHQNCVEVFWMPFGPSRPSPGLRGGQKGLQKWQFSHFGRFDPRNGLGGGRHQNIKVIWGTETASGGSTGPLFFFVLPRDTECRELTWAPRLATEGPPGKSLKTYNQKGWLPIFILLKLITSHDNAICVQCLINSSLCFSFTVMDAFSYIGDRLLQIAVEKTSLFLK